MPDISALLRQLSADFEKLLADLDAAEVRATCQEQSGARHWKLVGKPSATERIARLMAHGAKLLPLVPDVAYLLPKWSPGCGGDDVGDWLEAMAGLKVVRRDLVGTFAEVSLSGLTADAGASGALYQIQRIVSVSIEALLAIARHTDFLAVPKRSATPAGDWDEFVLAQGLTRDALLGFADERTNSTDDQEKKPDWLPAGWKSEFWPAEPTLPAAVAWLRRAMAACEYWNLHADANAQFPSVAGAGDYVHDAYRLIDKLNLATETGLPAKADRAQWTWQQQTDTLRLLLASVAQRLPKPAEPSPCPQSADPESESGQADMRRVLNIYTAGLADEQWTKAAEIVSNVALSVDAKLKALHKLIAIPLEVSAEKLAAELGVTKRAVQKTDWYKINREGKKDELIERRREKSLARGEQDEPNRHEIED